MIRVTAAAVIFARLLDKLDGLQVGSLLIRMDRSVHVTRSLWLWILSRLSETFFLLSFVFYVFTTTFWVANNVGVFIYTQFHSILFPQMYFLLLIKSCVVPSDYMILKVQRLSFSEGHSIQYDLWFLLLKHSVWELLKSVLQALLYKILLFVVLSVAHWTLSLGLFTSFIYFIARVVLLPCI